MLHTTLYHHNHKMHCRLVCKSLLTPVGMTSAHQTHLSAAPAGRFQMQRGEAPGLAGYVAGAH